MKFDDKTQARTESWIDRQRNLYRETSAERESCGPAASASPWAPAPDYTRPLPSTQGAPMKQFTVSITRVEVIEVEALNANRAFDYAIGEKGKTVFHETTSIAVEENK